MEIKPTKEEVDTIKTGVMEKPIIVFIGNPPGYEDDGGYECYPGGGGWDWNMHFMKCEDPNCGKIRRNILCRPLFPLFLWGRGL